MEEHNDRYSLSQLQDLIKEVIEDSLSGFYWVSAEISELKLNYSGHCYIELIEKTGNDDIKSRVRAIIWSQKARMLLPYFESSTGQELSEGLKVLLRVKPVYHRVYGLSLNVYDIDPAYTLGEMAILRKKIISRLETEGVINLNRELAFPLLPVSIAIISSELAAGYQDFCETLLNNEYGYTYNISLYKSVMQGKETEKSVSGAINRIFESGKKYDLIVIVRGGGSQADLSWFDNYNIAFLITQMPVPVITGIGHEKDLSVTDMVAHMAFKTPTAVAEFIISQSLRTEEYLAVLQESIISKSQDMVQKGRSLINRLSADLSPLVRNSLKKKQAGLNKSALRLSGSTRSLLAYKRSVLRSSQSNIINRTLNYVKEKKEKTVNLSGRFKPGLSRYTEQKHSILNSYSRSIDYLRPERVLKRGYSITLFNNKTVRSSKEVKPGSIVSTILNEGKIKSKVFDLNTREDEKG